MIELPIPLNSKTVSTKVAPSAWDRVDELAARLGCRKSDVVSIALLYLPEEVFIAQLDAQKAIIDALPKAVRGLLRHMDKLDEAQRKLVIDALSGPVAK